MKLKRLRTNFGPVFELNLYKSQGVDNLTGSEQNLLQMVQRELHRAKRPEAIVEGHRVRDVPYFDDHRELETLRPIFRSSAP